MKKAVIYTRTAVPNSTSNKKQEKLCCYFRFSKKLSEHSVRYPQEEIRKFDNGLPIREWLKFRPAADMKSLLRK